MKYLKAFVFLFVFLFVFNETDAQDQPLLISQTLIGSSEYSAIKADKDAALRKLDVWQGQIILE